MPVPDLLHRHRHRPLTVTVLGSAGTFGYPGNACSGYLVRTPTTAVWVDCGPGTLAVVQEHVHLADLDALVISHEHLDHWLEAPLLRTAAKHVLHIDRIAVYGTAGTRHLAEGLVGGPLDPLAWTDVTDGSMVRIGDLDLRFARTDHPVETLAMRFDAGGRTLAYSADTGPDWSFAALDPEGSGFDLALCEATMPEHEAGLARHLTGSQAGAMARDSGVRRLALTHLLEDTAPDRVDAASADGSFDGPVEVALPGHTFSV